MSRLSAPPSTPAAIRSPRKPEDAAVILETVLEQDMTYFAEKTKELQDMLSELQYRVHSVSKHCAESLPAARANRYSLPRTPKRKERKQKSAPSRKVFRARESMLSRMLKVKEFETIYHIMVAVLLIFGLSNTIEEYMEKQVILELELLVWAFGQPHRVIQIWLGMFGAALLPSQLFNAMRAGYLPAPLYYIAYGLLQLGMFTLPGTYVSRCSLPAASACIVMCEQVRLSMKMHAFVYESRVMARNTDEIRASHANKGSNGVAESTNRTVRQRKGKKKSSSSAKVSPVPSIRLSSANNDDIAAVEPDPNLTLLPTRGQRDAAYMYFLWAPTLIYRNAYPRTARIRWRFFFQRVLEVCGCIYYTYAVFNKYAKPQFERTAVEPGDLATFVASLFTSTLPAILVYFMAFFGLLHSWHNAAAELCCFADRQFYTDWWNTTSFSIYYRKWNILVHDWLYAYVYTASLNAGCPKTVAMLSVFLFSAVVHEYVITWAFGFFYPVLLVMFGVFGVGFIWVTRLFKGNRHWNIFFWFMMMIGNGGLMVLYSREWYARHSQLYGSTLVFDRSSWLPWSWQAFLQHSSVGST